eukprot:TRINITY_DN6588_c0_g1_i1.p1 TRINITY_DN6588_c0_g1~~TRINITY_DN6588_c0_g1_i1.p1  ORF type:complete len:286 (+),score=92.30 TRINITY_DN6588_c0_g1_i1:335-1192(+)
MSAMVSSMDPEQGTITPPGESKMSKADICGTPMSQVSTAPPTPAGLMPLEAPHRFSRLNSWATDPLSELDECEEIRIDITGDEPWEETEGEEDEFIKAMCSVDSDCEENSPEPALLCIGLKPLQSELGLWAKAEVEVEEEEACMRFSNMTTRASSDFEEDDDVEDDFIRAMNDTDADNSTEMSFGAPVLGVGLLPFRSELARWAASQVQQELSTGIEHMEGEEDDPELHSRDRADPGSMGSVFSQSKLAFWSRSAVHEKDDEEEEDSWIRAMQEVDPQGGRPSLQ